MLGPLCVHSTQAIITMVTFATIRVDSTGLLKLQIEMDAEGDGE